MLRYSSPDHRHSSHHIHRPLSKLPCEGRRKKSSKKRRKDKDHKSSHVSPSGPTEEGDEEEEEEEEEGVETTSAPAEAERAKDVEVTIWFIHKSWMKQILCSNPINLMYPLDHCPLYGVNSQWWTPSSR